jgi:hypothetical protein
MERILKEVRIFEIDDFANVELINSNDLKGSASSVLIIDPQLRFVKY